MLWEDFKGNVFEDVVADIDELSVVVCSLPGIAERTVGKGVPFVDRLRMIGKEHVVDGTFFIIGVAYTVDYLSVGAFLALQTVAFGVK